MIRQMKDSGIEWIGEIPAKWGLKRIKALFLERKEKNDPVKTDLILSLGAAYGVVPYSEKEGGGNKAKEDLTDYRLAHPNDIVMNSMNIISGSVGISRYFGCVSPVYYMLYPRQDDVDPEFYCYLFQTKAFQRSLLGLGNGILMKESSTGTFNTVRMRIPMEKLGIQPLPVPSLEEQKRISSYLGKKCAEIDATIKKTEATIEEYKTLKRVLITEKVTKGVSKSFSMKDSGIEWIGEIPAHWEIRKGKWILSRLERPVKDDDGVITCFRDGEVTLRSKRREDGFTFSLQEVGYQGIEPGDLVVHGMDGFAGAIGISDSRGKGTPVLNVLDSNQDKRYVMYYLRNMAYNGIFLALATGIRVRSCDTNWNKLKELSYLLPPIEEQKQIADYLDKKCAEIDTLIEKKTALLAEMETYKKSVIYEYVTGKKEVPITQQSVTAISYPYFPAVLSTDKVRFAQAILMSRILDKCTVKMGRVKLEKMLYTIENSIGFDFETQYVRAAAGPLDGSIYECEAIISRRNKWYTLNSSKYGVSYTPTKESSKYKKYYDKYFGEYDAEIDRIINIFINYDADQSEIIATLFASWNDFIIEKKQVSDEDIVDDVLNNWNDSKKRFSKDVWLRAIKNMRQNNLAPKGYGKHTMIKEVEV